MDPFHVINQSLNDCHKCPRLVQWREAISIKKRRAYMGQQYWGRPVPGFGDPKAKVFVLGLAPGAHGSNRTGRQFTGDSSGDFLYSALYRSGFASQPTSVALDDGLFLQGLYLTSVCRCVPPRNKPTSEEIHNCQPYLITELDEVRPAVIVALGKVAYDIMVAILVGNKLQYIQSSLDHFPPFSHSLSVPINVSSWLVASYHPSRQNTQTGRLTKKMFDDVWNKVNIVLG